MRPPSPPPAVIALCMEFDCHHWWTPDNDDVVPICPSDTTEDRSHHVVLYNLDEGHR
jgi:hypothetical protein